ncbi:hypothetical protein [Caldimonas sp. KR1-144]|uniref:hypothetical protein n=1 Tax=Caldimonas sp. KR1-144 TaxID=3400911 RepID=UPI003C0F56C4
MNTTAASDFDAFLASAWNEHGDVPEAVAQRLAAHRGRVTAPAQVGPFAALLAHVYGEHLGRWARGVELLDALRGAAGDDAAARAAIDRRVASLRHCAGEAGALEGLTEPDRVSALALAAAALAGRGDLAGAIGAFDEALACAQALPTADVAGIARALAVGGNNLASVLEEKGHRSADETRGMLAAARAGLSYWKLAGTWLEEERAEYRLARSLLKAGDVAQAVQAAQRCVAVCEANDAPALERFFGHAVLAVAYRSAGDRSGFEASRGLAMQAYDAVPNDERPWCEGDLAELNTR